MTDARESDQLHQQVFVRLLSPLGSYPSYRVATPNHVLGASENLAWSAVRQWSEDEHFRRGEIAHFWPEEIRFYGALSLVEPHPRSYGRFWIKTLGFAKELEGIPEDQPLTDEDAQTHAAEAAAEMAESPKTWEFGFGHPDGEFRLLDRYSPDDFYEILYRIPPDDPLLLRGLSKFLVAGELGRYAEEAGLAAFISMEASLEILRQELNGDHASFEDVFDRIRREFPTGESFASALQEAHDARTTIVHPSNRFGEFWTPPVYREECIEMLHYLVYLYRYILLDEVWEPAEYD